MNCSSVRLWDPLP